MGGGKREWVKKVGGRDGNVHEDGYHFIVFLRIDFSLRKQNEGL